MILGAALGAALTLGGCAQSTLGAPTALPSTGRDPVAFWRRRGSELAPRVDNMLPFLIVVYPDGQAIAEVTHTLHLSPTELVDLVSRLAGDLVGQPPTAAPQGGTRVMDAGLTVLGVRTATGTHAVTADALDELRGTHAYPAGLYDARDALGSLADRVTQQGTPYRADLIRLFAQPAGQHADVTPAGWLTGVPVPTTTDQYGVRYLDLTGAAATTVVAAVPPERFNWTPRLAPTGETLLISWRYLLPDE